MKTIPKFLSVGVVLTSIGTAGIASGHDGKIDMGAMQKMMQSMMPKADDVPSTKGLKEAHMEMMLHTPTSFSGNADVDFAKQMIPHHQGAIDMAKVQLANGKDPEMRKMAEKIIADQDKEIAQMNDWLKKNPK